MKLDYRMLLMHLHRISLMKLKYSNRAVTFTLMEQSDGKSATEK